MQDPGVLGQKVALQETSCAIGGGRSLVDLHIGTGQRLCPAAQLGVSQDTLHHGRAGDKRVKQIRPGFHQRLCSGGQGIPQAAGVFSCHGSGRPAGVNVAAQQLEDLSEGQVGIADAGVGIAVSRSGDEGRLGALGPPDKLLDQSRLATPGVAGDKDDPTLAR